MADHATGNTDVQHMELQGFASRHIGPSADEQAKMLAVVGHASRQDLAAAAVPAAIHSEGVLALPAAAGEDEALAEVKRQRDRLCSS